MDRYNSHTKYFSVCSAELKKCEYKRNICEIVKTALIGAGGASTVGLLMTLILRSVVPSAVIRAIALSSLVSVLGSIGVSRKIEKLEKEIQSFKFEDYVHADKN